MPDRRLLASLALARSAYDRASERRADADFLAAAWAGRTPARLLLLRDGSVPVDDDGLVLVAPSAYAGSPGVQVLLGIDDGIAYLALLAPEQGPPPVPSEVSEATEPAVTPVVLDGQDTAAPDRVVLPADVRWATLREVGAGLGARDSGLMTTAVALANWHRAYPRCPRCGTPTAAADAGWSRRCPADGSQHFPRHDAAVIVLVLDGADRALLGRRADWEPGWYSTLAGFVEAGESAEMTVVREMAEEAGVRIDPDRIDYLGSQPWPFPSSLMLGYHAGVAAGSPAARADGVEIAEVRWFTREELAAGCADGSVRIPPAVSIARRLVEHWYGAPLPGSWSRP
ncbi:MAG TPA: NAD(+) diphosphatase [Candidatus Nanopelagicales bacterium]|nr:NAD(+) diphosphatase [Candidatus Nanopelagicales bacterium]